MIDFPKVWSFSHSTVSTHPTVAIGRPKSQPHAARCHCCATRRSFPWIPRPMTWDIGSTQWSGRAKRWENHQGKPAWWTHDECMKSSWKSGEGRKGGPCWRAQDDHFADSFWPFRYMICAVTVFHLQTVPVFGRSWEQVWIDRTDDKARRAIAAFCCDPSLFASLRFAYQWKFDDALAR